MMVSDRVRDCNVHSLIEESNRFGDEVGAAIGANLTRLAMVTNDDIDQDSCNFLGGGHALDRGGSDATREVADEIKGVRELLEYDANVKHISRKDVVRVITIEANLVLACCMSVVDFGSVAGFARFDVVGRESEVSFDGRPLLDGQHIAFPLGGVYMLMTC